MWNIYIYIYIYICIYIVISCDIIFEISFGILKISVLIYGIQKNLGAFKLGINLDASA